MANCIYCKKPIRLQPSATERATRYGGTPKDYEKLFTSHSECLIEERNKQSSELMARSPREGTAWQQWQVKQ